jgi:cell division septation protein DedD
MLMAMIDRGPARPGRQIWITRGHLAALGTATVFIALLAFLVEYAQASSQPTTQGEPPDRDDLSFPAALRGDAADAAALGSAPPPTETTTTVAATPGDVPAPPEVPQAELPAGGWAVQVSAYPSPADAATKVAELTAEGLEAYTVAAHVNGETWYRVRIGGFEDRAQAMAARQVLADRLGTPDLLVAEAP